MQIIDLKSRPHGCYFGFSKEEKAEWVDAFFGWDKESGFVVNGVRPVPCPWCGKFCMVIEHDDPCGIRLLADCEQFHEAFKDDERNDAFGNDYGRTCWSKTLREMLEDWNEKVTAGLETNQLGVW